MSRLIDADKLIEAMYVRYDEKANNVPDNLAEGFMQVDKLIKEQPTAFDVDKVVEQLREKAKMNLEKGLSEIIPVKARPYLEAHNVLYDAIEIVKAGGRDEDIK